MLDRKKSEYTTLRLKTLDEVISSTSVKIGSIDFKYRYKYSPLKMYSMQEPNIKETIKAVLEARNSDTGEYVSMAFNVIDLPILTDTGYKLNGTLYQVQDSYRRAPGWFISEDKGELKLQLITDGTSPNFTIARNSKGILQIYRSERNKQPLASVLRGVTGLTYKELAEKLGKSNPSIIRNFITEPELDFSDCVNSAGKLLNSKYSVPSNIASQFKKLQDILFNNSAIVLAESNITLSKGYRNRYNKISTFAYKAKGLQLAEDVLDIKSGKILTEEDLTKLDNSDIEEIVVNIDSNRLVVKRIREKEYTGVKAVSLTPETLFNMINSYSLALEGVDLKENIDETYNKDIHSFNDEVVKAVVSNISMVTSEVMKEVSQVTPVPLTRAVDRGISKIDNQSRERLLRYIKQESKDAQTTDLNNSLAYAVRGYKAYTDNDKGVGLERRAVLDSFLGIIDPFNSPESKKTGLNHTKTLMCVTEDGLMKTHVVDVKKSTFVDQEVDGKIYRRIEKAHVEIYSPDKFIDKVVAMWNVDMGKERVQGILNGKGINVRPSEIDYLLLSPFSIVSVGTGNINFINHIDGKRVVMGANQNNQKIWIMGAEPPIIGTGMAGAFGVGVITAKDILENYYNSNIVNNENDEKISTEEFINLPITLKSTRVAHQDRILVFETEVGGKTLEIEHSIPFMVKNEKNNLFSTRVVPGVEVFQGDDVVAHNIDVYVDYTKNKYEYIGREEVEKWYEENPDSYHINEDGSYNTKRFNPNKYIDFGYFVPNKNFMFMDLQLGRNLYVGFKTYEGTTVDDANIINRDLVNNDSLTSVSIKLIEVELNKDAGKKDGDVETVTKLPQVGAYYGPNQVIVEISRGNRGSKPILTGPVDSGQVISVFSSNKYVSVLLADYSPVKPGDKLTGEHGNKGVIAKIVDAKDMPYNPKTGRPLDICLNALGIPTRMNPGQLDVANVALAIRNKSIAEGKKGRTRLVLSQFNDRNEEIIRQFVEGEFGREPEILIDGRTGLPFDRPIETGLIYMSKLEHTVESKVAQTEVTTKINPRTGRPDRGRDKEGGQKIGEMENIIIQLYGSEYLSDWFYNLKMDDIQSREGLLQAQITGDDSTIQYQSRNTEHLKLTLYSSLVYLNVDGENYKVGPLTDSMIKALDTTPINSVGNDITKELQSDNRFGKMIIAKGKNKKGDKDLSSLLNDKFTSKWSYIDLKVKIPSPSFVLSSGFGSLIPIVEFYINKSGELRDDDSSKGLPTRAVETIINTTEIAKVRYYDSGTGYIFVVKEDRVGGTDTRDLFLRTYPHLENKEIKGIRALVKFLETANVNTILDIWEDRYNRYNASKLGGVIKVDTATFDKIINPRNTLRNWVKEGAQFSDYVVSNYPVCPRCYRYNPSGEEKTRSDFDYYYQKIVDKCKGIDTDEQVFNVFTSIVSFLGIKTSLCKREEGREDLLNFLNKDGKEDKGFKRTEQLSTRVPFSGRTVIIPDTTGKLTLYEVGVPFYQIIATARSYFTYHIRENTDLLNDYNLTEENTEKLLNYIQSENLREIKNLLKETRIDKDENLNYTELTEQLIEDVYKYVKKTAREEFVAGCGRQPTLHPASYQGYFIVVTKGHALELHPSVCHGYNADFDGDQMHWQLIIDRNAQKDIIKHHMVDSNMLDYRDGNNLLSATQDILAGLYMLTTLHDNITSIYKDERYKNIANFNNLEMLKTFVDYRIISKHDLVCYKHTNGNLYLSTAGRIYFNSLLDNGFTDEPMKKLKDNGKGYEYRNPLGFQEEPIHEGYPVIKLENYKSLKFDGVIAKSNYNGRDKREDLVYISKDSILDSNIKELGVDNTMGLIDKMKTVGFYMADTSGITLSLRDFKQNPKMEKIIEAVKVKVDELNKHYRLKLITKEDRAATEMKLNRVMINAIEKGVLEPFDRNNNFYILIDSGARGSLGNLRQTCGMIGEVSAGKKGIMETPVISNYIKGLTAHEYQICSVGTRLGFSAQQIGVADSGYMSRKCAQLVEGVYVNSFDCGITEEETVMPLSYEGFRFFRFDELKDVPIDGKILDEEERRQYMSYNEGYEVNGEFRYFEDIDTSRFVGKELSKDSPEYERVSQILDNGKLNVKAIEVLKRQTVDRIITNEGTYFLYYSLSKKQKSQLTGRYSEDRRLKETVLLDDDGNRIPLLTEKGIITDNAIEWIESRNIRTLSFRNMITCKEEGFKVCARCYGIQYNRYETEDMTLEELKKSKDLKNLKPGEGLKRTTEDFPTVKTRVGLLASTTIGQISTQGKLDTVNKGAGGGHGGTNNLALLLNGTKPKTGAFSNDVDSNDDIGISDDGYVEGSVAQFKSIVLVEDVGKMSKVKIVPLIKPDVVEEGEKGQKQLKDLLDKVVTTKLANPSSVNVVDREIVEVGDLIINGYASLDSVGLFSRTLEQCKENVKNLRKKQQLIFNQYCDMLITEKDNVDAKNLEILTRVQASVVQVLSTDDPDLQEGAFISIDELEKSVNNGHKTVACSKTPSPATVHEYSYDPLKGLAFERHNMQIGKIISSNREFKTESYMSRIMQGAPADKTKPFKVITKEFEEKEPEQDIVISEVLSNTLENMESTAIDESVITEGFGDFSFDGDLDLDLDLGESESDVFGEVALGNSSLEDFNKVEESPFGHMDLETNEEKMDREVHTHEVEESNLFGSMRSGEEDKKIDREDSVFGTFTETTVGGFGDLFTKEEDNKTKEDDLSVNEGDLLVEEDTLNNGETTDVDSLFGDF